MPTGIENILNQVNSLKKAGCQKAKGNPTNLYGNPFFPGAGIMHLSKATSTSSF
jgi:hypothetical protein